MELARGKKATPRHASLGEQGQFLRRQIIPRRAARRSLWASLRWLAAVAGLGGVVAAGFWTAAAAGRAPELTVSRIRVEGNQRLTQGEILEALGLRQNANILSLDLEALKRRCLRSAWIKDVQLTRVLPATLTLHVVERVAVGVAVLDRLYLIDEEGTLLDELGPRYRDLALPLVRGLTDEKGRLVAGRAELAGRVLRALSRDERIASALSEIDVAEGAGSIAVRLRYPPLALLVAEEDAVDRLKEILPLVEGVLERFASVEVVDLRFRGRIYLRLGSGYSVESQPASSKTSPGGR